MTSLPLLNSLELFQIATKSQGVSETLLKFCESLKFYFCLKDGSEFDQLESLLVPEIIYHPSAPGKIDKL